jgi:hypothetical protein
VSFSHSVGEAGRHRATLRLIGALQWSVSSDLVNDARALPARARRLVQPPGRGG